MLDAQGRLYWGVLFVQKPERKEGINYRDTWRELYFKQQEEHAQRSWGKTISDLFEEYNEVTIAETEWRKWAVVEFEVKEVLAGDRSRRFLWLFQESLDLTILLLIEREAIGEFWFEKWYFS